MSNDEVVPVERYAEALAYLNSYPAADHATLLRQLNVASTAYREAAQIWPARIASELAEGRPALLLAFARAFNASQYHARLHHPPAHRVKPDANIVRRAKTKAAGARREPVAVEVSPRGDAGVVAAAVAVPTYLAPSDMAQVEAAQATDPDDTQIPGPNEAPRSLPFVRHAAAAPPPASSPRPRVDTGTELSEQNPTIFTLQLDDGSSETVTQLDLLLFSLSAYATITRRLAAGENRQTLLAEAGLSERRFSALASAWASQIQKDPMLGAVYRKAIREGAK